MANKKTIPLVVNTDLSYNYLDNYTASFLKNLTSYSGANNEIGSNTAGENQAVLKPLQSNEIYCDLQNEPDPGKNFCVGAKGFPQVNRVYIWAWNPNGNHFIYRINGDSRTCEMVKIDPCFNFQLDPRYFIHESGAWLEVFTLVDPDTGNELIKEELYWTDGFNYPGYLRVQDSIDTNGFDRTLYPYFDGTYDTCPIVRMGVPTPKDCIQIEEIPIPESYELIQTNTVFIQGVALNTLIIGGQIGGLPFSEYPLFSDQIVIPAGSPISGTYTVQSFTINTGNQLVISVDESVPDVGGTIVQASLYRRKNNDGIINKLLFNTWQFRIEETDVWGRPSEWGIISDMYVPGINDCISVSSNLPSCLNLIFNAGTPFTNSISISWRNCNDEVWKKEETIFLWKGSNIGKWWLRVRNPDINYDPATNKITYKFCRDKECDPVPVDETNRLENPIPKKSQSLFKLNNKIALANNTTGFNPISKTELDKIKFTITPPGAANPNARTVTIYVAIWNQISGNFGNVAKNGDKNYVYGGTGSNNFPDWPVSKKQYFENPEQSGFYGYLVNGQAAISTQVYVDAAGNLIDDPTFNGYSLSPTHKTFQKFVFNNVPKGSYIFRIASQTVNPSTDFNIRDTSTPIWGLCPFVANNYSVAVGDRTSLASCELFFDCCAGDYNTLNDNKMLVIADLGATSVVAQSGYVYENSSDKTRWELLKVQNGGVAAATSSIRTDANGFYWVYYIDTSLSGAGYLGLYAYSKCGRINLFRKLVAQYEINFVDEYMNTYFINPNGANLFTPSNCNYVQIKGRVLLQGSSIGVSNAVVSLTRGGQAITDNDGFFVLLAHDDASNENPYGQRTDKLIISGGGCTYVSLEPTGCIPTKVITFNACTLCIERVIVVGTTLVTYKPERGLLSGGTYLPRANFYDWLGRKTYSQPLGQLIIPTIIQSQAIGASIIQVDIDPTFTVPAEFKYFTISLTEETTIDKYIDWIVDRVEFIDNTNQINNIAPTQIKIYYQSIIEYSAVNNYNTTTAWQFIPTGQTTPAISDKVQFFLNGDGKFFTKNIIALVKYDQTGQYFTIDYTSELRDLKQNALMRLMRPKTCTGTEPDFEVCSPVELVNGKAQINRFILNAFDTYYLSRLIPVPAPVAPTPQVIQVATQVNNVTTYTAPIPVSTVLENRNFGFRFEHNSPSNFWGDGCKNIGRVNTKNPYECELVHPNQIAFGGALSINGQLNFLSYFSEANKHDVQISDTSGIVAVIPETGMLYVITQQDNVLIGYNDNLPRMNAEGLLQVPSGADVFGKPERKVGDRYGCYLKDKMSIKSRNGLVMYACRNRAEVVQYNFSKISSLTKDETPLIDGVKNGKCDAMFRAKVKNMDADPTRFFTGAIDPVTNRYLLTDFRLGDNISYINDLRTYSPLVNETLQFDIYTKDFLGWLSFTSENYAYLDGNILSNQLFSFKQAKAWSHYNVNTNNSYNTFFGVICERVMKLVFNKPAFTKKQWLSIMNYCKQSKYFAPEIKTEAGQVSALYLDNFDKAEFTSFAGFMSDINTPVQPAYGDTINNNPLWEGNQLYGLWISILLVGDPALNDKYSEFVGATVESFDLEKTG